MSRNAFFSSRSSRALNKKSFSLTLILWQKTNRNVVYRGLYSSRQRVRVITLFPNIFSYCFCMFLQVDHLHNAARVLSSPNCQQILTKISVVIFDIVVKKQIECRLAWHWWNSTDLGLIDMFLTNLNAEIVACILLFRKSRHKPNLKSISKYGFPPIWGEKWERSEHAHASYPGLSFCPLGFSPLMGREERKVRDWTSVFNCQQILKNISFVIFDYLWYCGKNKNKNKKKQKNKTRTKTNKKNKSYVVQRGTGEIPLIWD